ncbi:MAG: NAD-dependent epimerase/dehydratase family protein [Candidatus Obscuribacterales bacterium]|nr:NAD-dependent epimerase/dehydratase family protein [Candidatus Obscuribacterales bacterium]
MRVYITGVCGQVGSHVAELLLERGDHVWGIDNLATGRREHLGDTKNLTLTLGSIADKQLISETIEEFRPDLIVHAAASYKDPEDYHNDTLTNCVGAANLISAAKSMGVKRFIYFQTALCYGVSPRQQPIQLDHPLFPANSSYAISKAVAEQYLEISGLDYLSFRLANVIGPRNLSGPLPIFFQRLSEGKRCFVTKSRRDFVFVKDLAQCVLKAIDGTGHGAYHFSSGTDVAIKDLYDNVVAAMRLSKYPEPEVRDLGTDDAPSILLDPAKTFADFGPIDFTPLPAIVQSAVDYYNEYGVVGGYTHLRIDAEKKSAVV